MQPLLPPPAQASVAVSSRMAMILERNFIVIRRSGVFRFRCWRWRWLGSLACAHNVILEPADQGTQIVRLDLFHLFERRISQRHLLSMSASDSRNRVGIIAAFSVARVAVDSASAVSGWRIL